MKVVSFGNIPTWAGGRNDNGLSNVIYQLALNISHIDSVDMTLVATDVNDSCINRERLKIVGWTKLLLLKYALRNPLKVFLYLLYVLDFKIKYKQRESCLGIVLKMLFLNKSVTELKPDIVHLHGATSIIYLKALPKGVKKVMTIHGILGNDEHFEGWHYYSRLERACCQSKRLDRLFFISSKLIEDFKKEYGPIVPPTEAIRNAYDDKVFYNQNKPRTNETIKLITIATLSNIKGQERVLQAISKTRVDYTYECVGGDSDGLKDKLLDFAKDNHIHYTYYGPKKPTEINDLLADVDYMILPSSTEGFGLVYLEAMACGVPIILPKTLPIVQEPDIIIPGVNAILLDSYDVDSIAQVLPELKDMSFDRSEVSKSVSNNNWQIIAQEYASSFVELLRYE